VATTDLDHLEWRKSTMSAASDCVEVAFTQQSVLVRHSQRPDGQTLTFTLAEWKAFLSGVRNREFEHQYSQESRPLA
jgi:hypothetical protein